MKHSARVADMLGQMQLSCSMAGGKDLAAVVGANVERQVAATAPAVQGPALAGLTPAC